MAGTRTSQDDVPGSAVKLVCPGIVNVELGDAGPFEIVLYVDGGPAVAKATAVGLAGGSGGPLCMEAVLPAGQHELTIIVDEADGVLEFNERNNSYSRQYVGAGVAAEPAPAAGTETRDPILVTMPAASPVPGPGVSTSEPKPGTGQADLTVSAIKVNGRVPDGKDDCKAGKNAVTVVVKNVGTGNAEAFAVRLDADGDEVSVEPVDGLEAGKEREVTFEDVRLKKGERKLAATVDAKKAVAESNESNNELKVTAACKEGN